LVGLETFPGSAAPQRVHQGHHVLAARACRGLDRFSRPFAADELDQRSFIQVFDRFEASRLLVDDALGESRNLRLGITY
jgi:hypothetical protein